MDFIALNQEYTVQFQYLLILKTQKTPFLNFDFS